MSRPNTSKDNKIHYLNGLRGVAALVVVAHHYLTVFWPAATSYTVNTAVHTRIDRIILQTPLQIFFSGSLAVQIFFVLSGFVLTYKIFKDKTSTTEIMRKIKKRYFRLMPLVLFSVILGWIFSVYNLFSLDEVAHITGAVDRFNLMTYKMGLIEALWQGSIGVFITSINAVNSHNPVLWTIHFEFAGSIMVLLLAPIIKTLPKRSIIYFWLIFSLIATNFACFIAGMFLADLYVNRRYIFDNFGSINWFNKVIFLLSIITIGSIYPTQPQDSSGIFSGLIFNLQPHLSSILITVFRFVSAVGIVFAVMSWVELQRIFSLKITLWLGRVSFALYVTHWIIMSSFSTSLFVLIKQHFNYNIAAGIVVISGFAVSFLVAHILTIYIDEPAIKSSNKLFIREYNE